MFYYEIFLNLNNPFACDFLDEQLEDNFLNTKTKKSNFYNSLSYNQDEILKFLLENFHVFIKVFFLEMNFKDQHFKNDDSKMIIDDVHKMKKISNENLDEMFENLVFSSNKTNNYNEFLSTIEDKNFTSDENNYAINIKIEIVDILCLIIRTYKNDNNYIHFEIRKFIIDLVDVLVKKKDHPNVLRKIENLSNIYLIFIRYFLFRYKYQLSCFYFQLF